LLLPKFQDDRLNFSLVIFSLKSHASVHKTPMMEPTSSELKPDEPSPEVLQDVSSLPLAENTDAEISEQTEPIVFHCHFEDTMELCGKAETVSQYLQNHQDWFVRCSLPMKAQPLGENGYDLLVGRFGSFGYQVEARVGLELLPPDAKNLYIIKTIPIPNYTAPGYEVDFQSTMELLEFPISEFYPDLTTEELSKLPSVVTSAQWKLDLNVAVKFPAFILSMSRPLIQKTGDRLLETIVHQVNRRLTYKTQVLFYDAQGIPFLKKLKKKKVRR